MAARAPVPIPHQHVRILIADDHPVIRKMVRAVLERRPEFEVCGEAVDGAKAIERAKNIKLDVVVLNVTMPVVNGLNAAHEIKKLVPDIAVVILSSHVDKHFVGVVRKMGVRAYVA